MRGRHQLIIAAALSFTAALLHIAIIFGGADWYRFFGAGEQMAQLAQAGSMQPTVITLAIALLLSTWGLYALSAANVIFKLPLLKPALCLITLIYMLRGIAGLILPFVSTHPAITENSITFWLVSSVISCTFGLFYLLGTVNSWKQLAR